MALVHGLGAIKDLRSGPLLGLTALCALAVTVAVVARLAGAQREIPRTLRVPLRLAEYSGPGLPGQPRQPAAGRPLSRAGRS